MLLTIPPHLKCDAALPLPCLVKHQYRKTSKNLNHAPLSTTNHKVV